MKHNKNGFTLIELLVVVLIIGILAAVALPQYQRAVKKARATEDITNLKAITRAQTAYFLANGVPAANINDLDIQINGNFYRYHCINNIYSSEGDCYATPQDGSAPFFEEAFGKLWCRGTAEQCKPFSTTSNGGTYWLIEELSNN